MARRAGVPPASAGHPAPRLGVGRDARRWAAGTAALRGILGRMKFELGQVDVHKRKSLPHWNVQHGIYFVTFNLLDAIPKYVREQIREEAEAQVKLIRAARGEAPSIEEWIQARLSEALDNNYGSCFMRDHRVASIVARAIEHFNGSRYELLAWCVMPNHVHVVMTLATGERIDRIIHSWKSYSSKEANQVLGRVGSFWHEDYFDHSVRDDRELHGTIEYVLNNPAKAGLGNWPFVGLLGIRL